MSVGTRTTGGAFGTIQRVRFGASPLVVTVSAAPASPPRILSGSPAVAAPSATFNIAAGLSATPSTLATGGAGFRFAGGSGTATVTATATGATPTTSSTVTVTVNP